MISLLSTRSLNTEVDGTGNQCVRAFDGTTLNTDGNMEKIIAALITLLVLLSAAINRLKEKSEQKSYDDIRDDAIVALYYLLFGLSHSPKAKIKAAAISLLEIFDKYGLKMQDQSYTSESSLINSLLVDYATPEAQANIDILPQAPEYVGVLASAQSSFENVRLQFEEARGQEGTMENATAIKKDVLEIINNQLVPYLNVMTQLDEATYGSYATTVAELISENNTVVKKRQNKTDEPEED